MKLAAVATVCVLSAALLSCGDAKPTGPEAAAGNSDNPSTGGDPSPGRDTTSKEVSLEGTLAFVSTRDGKAHIYLSNVDGSDARRLTTRENTEGTPAWSPDGDRIAFTSDDGVYVIKRDGSGLVRVAADGGPPSWSPDGTSILLGMDMRFQIVAADGTGAVRPDILIDPHGFSGVFAENLSQSFGGSWSPDGIHIAFAAMNGADFMRAMIMNVDSTSGRAFLMGGSTYWDECGPVWSPDGRRIALLSMVRGILVVDMTTGVSTHTYDSGTTCWGQAGNSDWGDSGIAWSPDAQGIAVTRRDPPWVQGRPDPRDSQLSIEIVEISTRKVLSTIKDAFDPAWTSKKE